MNAATGFQLSCIALYCPEFVTVLTSCRSLHISATFYFRLSFSFLNNVFLTYMC